MEKLVGTQMRAKNFLAKSLNQFFRQTPRLEFSKNVNGLCDSGAAWLVLLAPTGGGLV